MNAICKIYGCAKKAEKRGMCGAHYFRWRKHGDALGGRIPNGTAARFLDDLIVPEGGKCLLWPFTYNDNGYGAKVRGEYPHQFLCRKFNGPKPTSSHEVAHNCGNRACVNPSHLRWALHIENVADQQIHGTTIDGERCGASKLTNEAVREIRAATGLTHSQLAAQFGISRTTISVIRSRKTWKHI